MANDDRISKIEKEIDKIKEIIHSQEILQLKDKTELKELISQAVETGNEKIIKKIEDQDKRIMILENQEAKRALSQKQEFWKTVRTVGITFFATLLLNNFTAIISNNISNENINKEAVYEKRN